jgi:hypothetical protein
MLQLTQLTALDFTGCFSSGVGRHVHASYKARDRGLACACKLGILSELDNIRCNMYVCFHLRLPACAIRITCISVMSLWCLPWAT